MSKVGTKKLIEELFGSNNDKLENLKCPKCLNTETFSTSTIAVAVAVVDKTKKLLEIKDLIINLDESLWQCEKCNCVFDEYGDRIA